MLLEFSTHPEHQMTVAMTWIDNVLAIYEDIFDETSQSIVLCLECLAKRLFNVENYWANWDNYFVDLTYQENKSIIETLFVLLESWRQETVRTHYVFCPEIERFYFDVHWAFGNREIAANYFDELIAISEKYQNSDLDTLIIFKCQVCQYLNKDYQCILNQYQHLPKICQMIADDLINSKQFTQAISIIKNNINKTNNRLIK